MFVPLESLQTVSAESEIYLKFSLTTELVTV